MAAEKIFFQTIRFVVKNPITGKKVERIFAGKALFTPEEIEKLKEYKIEDLIEEAEFDRPYNPYEDPENTEAHRYLTDLARKSLDKSEKQ